jgi:GntR family transcriptional regulator, transcriptional repressor for pyruvate dehydrogenase complex
MTGDFVIKNFKQIVVAKPVDIIIEQIKELITSGQLNPGDKLPSERKLSEAFNIGRTHVRDAIRKLEFYGILKTLPQSGTVVAGIGMTALEGLISDVLQLENTDFNSLVETRVILEIEIAKLATNRRTEEDLVELEKALNKYYKKANKGEEAIDEDMMFHLKIAEASHNKVLKSLMLIIIPDILANYAKYKVCTNDRLQKRYDEHKKLFNAIVAKDPEKAAIIMQTHLKDIIILGHEIKL